MDRRVLLFSGMLLFLCHGPSIQAVPEEILPEPYNVHIDERNLTWTPRTEKKDTTYTVEYSWFNNSSTSPLLGCANISTNTCQLTSPTEVSQCMNLSVRAEQHGRRSSPVQACSTRGGLCSPDFSLTAAPGSITVHLTKNSSVFLEYAGHSQNHIYFWKEGEEPQSYEYAASSVYINNLEVGQRYCAMVEFIVFLKPFGTARCIQCEVIPAPDHSKRTVTIITVVVVIVLLVLVPIIAYVLIFQLRNIKKILKPQYNIPLSLMDPVGEKGFFPIPSSSSTEICDLISVMTPEGTARCPTPPRSVGSLNY